MKALRVAADGNDAEALALMFEIDSIEDDGTLDSRVDALVAASEHAWVPGLRLPVDVPGLCELKGFSDVGFREEFRDPWPASREQAGHLLTSLALARRPEIVRTRRFGFMVRDLSGAPRSMGDEEVAIRLIIGHEKAPDPRPTEPLILVKIRRQFSSASAADVSAYRAALDELKGTVDFDIPRVGVAVGRIDVGTGTGNSMQDLLLSLAGYHMCHLIGESMLPTRADAAAWVRKNLKAPSA